MAGDWKELCTNSQGLMLELSGGDYLVPGGRGIPWGMITYIWLEMGFRAREHTATAEGTLERDCQRRQKAARRNNPEEFLALRRAKLPCPRFCIAFGMRERVTPELNLQGGCRVPFNIN